MRISGIGATSDNKPGTYPHERFTCGGCRKCHPGFQFGRDAWCHQLRAGLSCACHRTGTT